MEVATGFGVEVQEGVGAADGAEAAAGARREGAGGSDGRVRWMRCV
jgi:hypothetical protein